MIKKILFYTDTHLIGGAEKHIFDLASGLDQKKYFPILACSRSSSLDLWCSKFLDVGISVFRLNVCHKHDPRHYFQLKKLIQNQEIDLVHMHVWNPASCRYGYFAARFTHTPLVITEHDPFPLSFLKNLIKRYLLRFVDAVIAVSERNKNTLEMLYPGLDRKIITIYIGIDAEAFEEFIKKCFSNKRADFRMRNFGLEAGDRTVIFLSVGALHRRKGHRYLLEAVASITKNFKDARITQPFKVILAGDGAEMASLRDQAKDLGIENNIIFLGFRADVPFLMAASDIFVLPSIREAFGLVLLEAMCAKLPLIATACAGVLEIVDESSGLLVDPENSHELAIAMERLLSNPDLRVRFGEGGYNRVRSDFDIGSMVRDTAKVYDFVLDRI